MDRVIEPQGWVTQVPGAPCQGPWWVRVAGAWEERQTEDARGQAGEEMSP